MVETVRADLITCPFCGYQDKESWKAFDLNEEDKETECSECGKPFHVTRNVSVDYTSREIKP